MPLQETNANTTRERPAPSKPEAQSNKRPIAALMVPSEPTGYIGRQDDDAEECDDDCITYSPSLNCNKIRTKIQALIDSGEMKVTHFQRDLGINSNSYGRFMKLKGPWSGIDNQTYHAAYLFFRAREAHGIKTGAKKRKSNDGSAVKGGDAKKAKKAGPPDVSDVQLDGEEENTVEVYDTPAEIRKKISAHMPKDGVMQAGFCRAIGAQFNPEKKIASSQLQAFRKHSGPDKGNTSAVYYGAYVYFEKLRIKEGKPKTKHRLEMERIWEGQGGYDTERPGPSTGG